MDFDFMDVVFVLVWLFFLSKAIFGGRKKKRSDTEFPPMPPEEDLPKEEPTMDNEPTDPSGESYDYKKLRERILTSWGDKKETEQEPPEEMIKKEEPKQEKTLSSMKSSATIEKKVEPALKKMHPSVSLLEEQKKLLRKAKEAEARSHAVAAAYSPVCLEQEKHKRKKWTAADAKQWLVYDAIFGAPRSRAPWRPR